MDGCDSYVTLTVRIRPDLADRLRAVSRKTGVRIYRLVEIALEKELKDGVDHNYNRRRKSRSSS
ncbi:MAG: ribbon-helix-helix domain-containing protein [Bacteroidetes bacterium]|nr:MAG: ribbon-helix-helix domain-containing protein [Bacteroidota bacterium]